MASNYSYPPKCKYPGCTRPCYVERYGRVHEFCGRTHAEEYKKLFGSYYSGLPGFSGAGHSLRGKTSSPAPGPLKATYTPPVYSPAHLTSPSTSHEIKFYNRGEPHYQFTNFYPCRVLIDGQVWPTTEHYFQAQKFVGTPYVEHIRCLHLPRDAFQLSRDPKVSRWRRSDWESVKDKVMLKALRAKFSDQNPQLVKLLLSTGDKKLIEHTSNDSYWGDGGNGMGSNKLGLLLMQVRKELRAKRGVPPTPSSKWSQDDSALSHTPAARTLQPNRPLRRSNSLSSISSSPSQHKSEMVTGRYSNPSTVHGSPASRGTMPSPSRSRSTPRYGGKGSSSLVLSIPEPIKKTAKVAKDTLTSAKSHLTGVMNAGNSPLSAGCRSPTQSHPTTSRTTHKPHPPTSQLRVPTSKPPGGNHGGGTASSVKYDIITHMPKKY